MNLARSTSAFNVEKLNSGADSAQSFIARLLTQAQAVITAVELATLGNLPAVSDATAFASCALFQSDAQTRGAERAIIVTSSRFTCPARKAATSTFFTVDLINGDRLVELIHADCESGVQLRPTADTRRFFKFK